MSNLERTVPNLLTAPLDVPNPSQALGRSLWLYLALAKHVNSMGLVIRRREELANDLSVSESAIDEWLSRLVRAELIQVLSSGPFLTVRLPFWSRSEAKIEKSAAFAGQSEDSSNSSRNSSNARASIPHFSPRVVETRFRGGRGPQCG